MATTDDIERLCEVHDVDEYDDLPAVVRNAVEAEDTRVTDESFEPCDGIGGLFR